MQRTVSCVNPVQRLRLPGPVGPAALRTADVNNDGVLEAVVGCMNGQLLVVGLGSSVRTCID